MSSNSPTSRLPPAWEEPHSGDQYAAVAPAPSGAQRALAENTISAGHARALLGTPDRASKSSWSSGHRRGLDVRVLESCPWRGSGARADLVWIPNPQVLPRCYQRPAGDAAPAEPGCSNSRAPVDAPQHAREGGVAKPKGPASRRLRHPRDLERIYRLMVGEQKGEAGHPASQRAFELDDVPSTVAAASTRRTSHGAVVTLEEQD